MKWRRENKYLLYKSKNYDKNITSKHSNIHSIVGGKRCINNLYYKYTNRYIFNL